MSEKNLTNEVRRLSATITAVERQRNEALTARAHAEATAAMLQENLREVQAALTATKNEIDEVKKQLIELQAKDGGDEKPAKKVKNAA